MQAFDPDGFRAVYPQFDYLSPEYLTDYYTYEALVLGSKVLACFDDGAERYRWSCVVLAHILTLTATPDTDGNSGLGGTFATGRTSQATEGSVSGSFEFKGTEDSTWWDLTPYGQKVWQIYRMRGGATYYAYGNNQSTMESF